VKGAKAAWSFTAGHIWPYKMVMHLLSLAVAAGVNLQTTTPVTGISSETNADGYWTVSTPRGDVLAKKIIYATNGYTAGVAPQYTEKIIPSRGICSRITTPKAAPNLPCTYSLRHSAGTYDYLIPRPDGSIVVGGARSMFFKDLKEWYGVVDDGKLIEPARDYFDGYMQRHFRGWEDSGAVTDRVWTGSKFHLVSFRGYPLCWAITRS
jgi:glycine/D-amino acid oxidase-like deaminating enzyme